MFYNTKKATKNVTVHRCLPEASLFKREARSKAFSKWNRRESISLTVYCVLTLFRKIMAISSHFHLSLVLSKCIGKGKWAYRTAVSNNSLACFRSRKSDRFISISRMCSDTWNRESCDCPRLFNNVLETLSPSFESARIHRAAKGGSEEINWYAEWKIGGHKSRKTTSAVTRLVGVQMFKFGFCI